MHTVAICVQFVCGASDESYTGQLYKEFRIGGRVISNKCKKNYSLSTTYNGEMTHRKQQNNSR